MPIRCSELDAGNIVALKVINSSIQMSLADVYIKTEKIIISAKKSNFSYLLHNNGSQQNYYSFRNVVAPFIMSHSKTFTNVGSGYSQAQRTDCAKLSTNQCP